MQQEEENRPSEGEPRTLRELNVLRPILGDESLLLLRQPGPPFYMFVSKQAARACGAAVTRFGVWINPLPPGYVRRLVGRSYVGRGAVVPSRVSADLREAFPCFESRLALASHFELLLILRGRAVWVAASDGEVPACALPVGVSRFGEQEFAARVLHHGVFILGRVQSTFDACHVVLRDGVAAQFRHYEVLGIRE